MSPRQARLSAHGLMRFDSRGPQARSPGDLVKQDFLPRGEFLQNILRANRSMRLLTLLRSRSRSLEYLLSCLRRSGAGKLCTRWGWGLLLTTYSDIIVWTNAILILDRNGLLPVFCVLILAARASIGHWNVFAVIKCMLLGAKKIQ